MIETTQAQGAGTTPAAVLQDTPITDTGIASLAAEKIRARYPDAILDTYTYRGETTLTIRPQDLLNVARLLREDADLSFRHLANVTSVDWSKYPGYAARERFTAVYQLLSTKSWRRLGLKVPAPGGESPVVPSLTSLWRGADWPEREVYDLMGVRLDGHPDLRRIMMPASWPNHPLRKELPRGGERVPFSMTWEDEEFESFGKQIIEARSVQQVPPKQADANKHMILNLGPHHPSTHGVLRVIVELDGETVVAAYPDLGYLHSGFEKQGETIRYKDFLPYTDRSDYLSSMCNNLCYAIAVEKLMGAEIPPRAQVIRVIMAELQRIASHLLWLGTHVMDASGMSHAMLMYSFREREQLLDIFELVSGARLTTSYIRPGGVWRDVPPSFSERVNDVLRTFPGKFDEYEKFMNDNPVWRARTEGVGKLTAEQCLDLCVTGPMARASGIPMDYRKIRPYSGYENYDFIVPTATEGDTFARYMLRIEEMRQSLRIVEQGLKNLPDGPVWSADRKMVPPPRQELDVSMEAVIHHFKLYTEGMTPPKGEIYECGESPRGEEGFYLVSDGSAIPYRLRFRTPSFHNLQALHTMSKDRLVADLVVNIGSIDIVLGDVDR
jgi:NADH-quinone oxidoreductase subunit C/D